MIDDVLNTTRNFFEDLKRWSWLIHEIEFGYVMGYLDYTNSLTLREIIEREKNILPDDCNDDYIPLLNFLDKKFIEHTKPIDFTVFGKEEGQTDLQKMLYRRIPKNLVEDLKEDLEFMIKNRN
jgi:hypothetical protein